MQTIIRFGTKKGFKAFPDLVDFGSIGNELGTEQGLYLPASIIQSHARFVQERGAQGMERCLVFSKRSSKQRYHVLALIVPVDEGKPEWRDGAFVGVAMLAEEQMIREKEALAVLESDLKDLLSDNPISSGQSEGSEQLNWQASNRPVDPSLCSTWVESFQPHSAHLIPAFNPNEPWHQRVKSSLDSISNSERAIILPLHEAAPNISGWSPRAEQETSPEPQRTTSGPASATNDDIKRLENAFQQECKKNAVLVEENKRLETAKNQAILKQSTLLLVVGVVALLLGAGIGWVSTGKRSSMPERTANQPKNASDDAIQTYWESLVFRSMHPDSAYVIPLTPSSAFRERAWSKSYPIARAALNLKGAVGSKFFEWRLDDLRDVLSEHHVDRKLPDELLCEPCLKYGIIEFQSEADLMDFNGMKDTLASNLDSLGNEFLKTLLINAKAGFLGDARLIAVRDSVPLEKDIKKDAWKATALEAWETKEAGRFRYLTGAAKMNMIFDLTEYADEGVIKDYKQGEYLFFWVPKER